MTEPEIMKPTPEMDESWKKAGERQKADREKQGHGDDGNYYLLETDLEAGTNCLMPQPQNPEEVAVFAHPNLAEQHVSDWGEAGFGYMILKAVHGLQGVNAAETLAERRAQLK